MDKIKKSFCLINGAVCLLDKNSFIFMCTTSKCQDLHENLMTIAISGFRIENICCFIIYRMIIMNQSKKSVWLIRGRYGSGFYQASASGSKD